MRIQYNHTIWQHEKQAWVTFSQRSTAYWLKLHAVSLKNVTGSFRAVCFCFLRRLVSAVKKHAYQLLLNVKPKELIQNGTCGIKDVTLYIVALVASDIRIQQIVNTHLFAAYLNINIIVSKMMHLIAKWVVGIQ